MDVPRNIIVSGHTDNVPIKNATYESNWELSVMRAINFMENRLKMNNWILNSLVRKGMASFNQYNK